MCKQKALEVVLRCDGCDEMQDTLYKFSVKDKGLYLCSDCLEFIKQNGMMRNVFRRDSN